MIYRSNLEAPDLSRFFKHLTVSPMGHSFGHSIPRDWADKSDDDPVFGIWRKCGSWTHDEGAILAACARQYPGGWLDIGCNTGMLSKLINWQTNGPVMCVDYMLGLGEFFERFKENTGFPMHWTYAGKSDDYFDNRPFDYFSGVVIDGDHDRPQPLKDARNAASRLSTGGVILFHDFWGEPVQEAVTWLMDHGFKSRIYFTPHGVAACWRGDYFVPPDHTPDPSLPDLKARCPNFNFERCV